MIVVGFEPTKHIASDLESLPFDRSGTLSLFLKGIFYPIWDSNPQPPD
jgi:hypothetical protein